MFKKSADLIHLHDRTGSHATKGSGRGTVRWRASDPDAFDAKELRLKKKLLLHQIHVARGQYRAAIEMHSVARERGDGDAARAIVPGLRAFRRNLKRLEADLISAKALLFDHSRGG